MGTVMRRRDCGAAAILAMALVLGWSAARVHYTNEGNWTALFCSGVEFSLPPELAATTYRAPLAGYDGQFYRLLAHDPFLTKGYARYVDAPRLRFRRCLLPMAAWLLALGREAWIDGAYIAVELLFVSLGVYWCARLLVRRGRPPWWGLLFVAAPASLASIDRMLVDAPLTALFAGFLLYCEEERWTRVWVLAALAGLTRETGLLMPAALVADRVLRRDWRGAIRFGACAVPALGWYAFLATRVPSDGPHSVIGIPGWNLVARLLIFRTYFNPSGQIVLRTLDFLAVAGLIGCLILAAIWLAKRPPTPAAICVALYACLALVLGPPVMIDPFGFGRLISPLLVWVMMEAVARKKWAALAPPLLISLNVSLVFARPMIDMAHALLRR
jgi:hypothetical protein